ncbi:serine hydrolase [Roseovarius sp. EL26]|uniref:serine hydrolase n=1 Tax=Roseovarius sp. EL26 TaxID=2126672 RepID=UPI0013C430EF|nr:serine hydrolase [Roseovarius sp. EL26]
MTRTEGIYAPRGAGVVTITTSEWRVDGVQAGTAANYTPIAGDVGKMFSYHEVVTETGGIAPGVISRSVVMGVVQAEPVPTPLAAGGLIDQTFTKDTGVQTYSVSGDFTNAGSGAWSLSVNPDPVNITINVSGVISFDTGALAVAAGSSVVATYTNVSGSADSGFSLTIETAVVITAPEAFAIGMWELLDPATGGDLSVTISSLPASGGALVTDIEYRLDGGSWVTSGGTGDFTISGLSNGTSVDIELRAVNSVGASTGSDSKAATPTAAPVFTPATISGLSSWIKANTAVTVDGGNMVTAARDVRDAGYPDPNGAPVINALAACAMDVASGEILYWKEPSFAATPASITKSPVIAHALRIMAGYGVTLADNVTMEAGDFEGAETTPPLAAGDTMTLGDLMYIAMLESANAAVRCVARVLGRKILSSSSAAPQVAIEAFITNLSAALKADGISGFHMESVSGVFDFEGEMLGGPKDSDHVTTAHAAAGWARYAHQTSGMDAIWGASSYSYTITAGPNAGSNTIGHLIGMVADTDIYGLKGGALPGLVGKTLHAVADLPDGRKVAVAVLQSVNREGDARDIITYCAGISIGTGQQAVKILPGNGVRYWKEGSDPAPTLVSDAVGPAFDFGLPTNAVGPYLRADIPDVQTMFFVWDREVSQTDSTVWEAYMDIWGGEQQSERLSTLPGTNGWWVKPAGVTVYKNGSPTDALLPFGRCVVAITDSDPDSIGVFGAGRVDEFRNLSGKVREIITYHEVLTAAQIQAVTDYLIAEYGIL